MWKGSLESSGARSTQDDFFCEKYQVWYPMQDCNYRVRHATYDGCVDCFQGRVNLRPPRSATASNDAAALIPFPQLSSKTERKQEKPGQARS